MTDHIARSPDRLWFTKRSRCAVCGAPITRVQRRIAGRRQTFWVHTNAPNLVSRTGGK